jgi:hypothetical protein
MPLEVNWWVNTVPIWALWWTDSTVVTPVPPDPLHPVDSDDFFMVGDLDGSVEYVGVDTNGNNLLTYVYNMSADVSQSFAKRRPPAGANGIIYLNWNFHDPGNVLNRSHITFPQAFDLGMRYSCTSWWQPHP